MGKTVLQLVQSACYSAGFTSVPSALAAATAFGELQLLQLFYDTGEELRAMRCWPQLQKKHFIDLVPGRREYPLPLDFYGMIPFAGSDQATSWPLDGPLSPSEWNYRLFGYVTVENRTAFRVFGPDINPSSAGQFVVDPVPGDAEAGLRLTFEYVSRSWLCPPLWTSGTSFGADTYCFCGGNVYQKPTGSANCGTVPLSMARGEGQDGGVRWTVFAPAAWGSSTLYQAGTYVTNDGGKLYVCTVGGTSAGSGGPTGSGSAAITDNTCTWEYRSTSAWAGQTEYARGDIVTVSGTRYYRCTNPPGSTNIKSGSVTPTWAVSGSDFTQSDGTITWTHKPAAYTAIRLDTDLCLFDDELMQLGLKWRFHESKGQLVQALNLKKQYDNMREAALGRWNGSRKVSLVDGGPAARELNVPEGSFTF